MLLRNRLGLRYAIGGYRYQSESLTLFSALSGTYSTARKIAIDTMIKSLKSAGVWAKLDVLQIYAAPTAADAVVNWKTPGTFNATLVNSPTLEVDRGITGDGASSYINSGYNPTTASINYLQNNATLGVYSRSIGTAEKVFCGAFETPKISGIYSANAGGFYTALNNSGLSTPSLSKQTTLGLVVFSRAASSGYTAYINGTSIGNLTNTSASPPNYNYSVLALRNGASSNTAYSNSQISVMLAGAALDATQHLALYTALETYLDSIGAGVIS